MYKVDKSGQLVWIHVGVDSVAQVGNISSFSTKSCNHFCYPFGQILIWWIESTWIQITLQCNNNKHAIIPKLQAYSSWWVVTDLKGYIGPDNVACLHRVLCPVEPDYLEPDGSETIECIVSILCVHYNRRAGVLIEPVVGKQLLANTLIDLPEVRSCICIE